MVDFNVIMGMDWLSSCYAILDCRAKLIRFQFPNEEVLEWKGISASLVGKFISYLKAQRMIAKGCLAYLAHIINPESDPPALQSVPVVREFPEVFPDDLPGLPPERIIDFGIDLMPGTQPISIPPYRMAPAELNELREQLKDLLDKGFIRPIQRQTLGREIQKLANDGIRLDETEEGGITAYALAQSSLVVHVKAKQDEDPYLVKLKGVKNKEITAFILGSDGVLKLNDQLCVPDVGGLMKAIMEEAHSSRCRSPVGWFEPAGVPLIGPEFVCEPLEKVQLIREILKATQSCQKSYSDKRHRDLEFMIGDKVFLKVSPMKGVMRFGKKGKLSPRFIGPYEIIEKKGKLDYELALPIELSFVHLVYA
ncbi:uncharacterized protein LOC142169710 [Nicotiana tabacum]|uniref:Uncharacterized protein LOC142169710 n=1 Tax=Nicotiana tabacum TaxID=4097 RepID=A0AC58SRX1_TOBAC